MILRWIAAWFSSPPGSETASAPVQPPLEPALTVTARFPRATGPETNRPGCTAHWPTPEEAARLVEQWQPGRFLIGRDHEGRYYGIEDDRHILTVAGSRAGKGTSLIVPNLLFWPGSAICIDPKGELATLTASRRSAQGSQWSQPMHPGRGRVFALDPFERVSGPAVAYRAAFNPLADLDPDSECGVQLSWQIADALIVQNTGEGSYWTMSARTFLRGVILYVAKMESGPSKSLLRVREIITMGADAFAVELGKMKGLGGIIGRAAHAMDNRPPHEKASVLSSAEAQTAFLDGPEMDRVLKGSDFRLEDLKSDRVTVYLCLPATNLSTHGRWLRLMIALTMSAMERTGPIKAGRPPVLFCLDEFATLGHMESVESAAGHIAGYGVKLWPIVQDITQLQRDYREAWETFMGNAGLLTFFGNTDLSTLSHISSRLGSCEVTRYTTNRTSTWQRQHGGNTPDVIAAITGQGSGSRSEQASVSGNEATNEQIVGAPLMTPDEIARHFSRDAGNILALIPRPDLPPLPLYRARYFDGLNPHDAALFGGLYDPAPEQPAPHMTAAERVERDTARLWHVPVVEGKQA